MEKLTQDLIIDILSRLPTVPLLQSRCVCKSWHHIITFDAIFYTLRNNHQSLLTNADALTLISPSHFTDKSADQLYFTHFNENVRPLIQKIDVSSFIHGITKEVYLRVVGVCNGLICLATFQKPLHGLSAPMDKRRIKSFQILNPISRENLELPNFEEESLLSTSDGVTGKISKRRFYGFGFDKCNQVFKLVLFLVFDDVDDEYGNSNNVVNEMFVFTFGSGWRRSLGEVPSMIRYAFSDASNVCVNGCLYWITCTAVPDSTNYSLVIMSFNLGDETFGTIETPEMIVVESAYYLVQAHYYYTLAVFENRLCWIDMKNDKHINIWIKKSDSEESWIKKFCLQKNLLPGHYGPVRPIKLERNGELFLYHRNHVISYNVRCNMSKFFIIDEELEGISHDEGFPFAGSFISVSSQ
ncbi:hypothetical protein FRX31_001949 [Thalictrum thalictroides]|uniref:F-box domain-containing protein n=1 Tax=Thalictrum thalictroides TaxID=46969 RepID=A0A7J6XF99_THATH|nr:hypothetical protein FRX31_001949 [Thalictrum thalictroides]